MVERYLEVDVEAVNPMGDLVRMRCSGWQARILQHEVDHLQVHPCWPSSQLPPPPPPLPPMHTHMRLTQVRTRNSPSNDHEAPCTKGSIRCTMQGTLYVDRMLPRTFSMADTPRSAPDRGISE